MERIEKAYDKLKSYYDIWQLEPDELGLEVVQRAVVEMSKIIEEVQNEEQSY